MVRNWAAARPVDEMIDGITSHDIAKVPTIT